MNVNKWNCNVRWTKFNFQANLFNFAFFILTDLFGPRVLELWTLWWKIVKGILSSSGEISWFNEAYFLNNWNSALNQILEVIWSADTSFCFIITHFCLNYFLRLGDWGDCAKPEGNFQVPHCRICSSQV